MITREDLLSLQNHKGYPCISILVKTHREMPQRKQDPINVKNAIKDASDKITTELKSEANELISALENLADKIDYAKTLDGIAFFIGKNFARSYDLPFSVDNHIVIDKIFAIKKLVNGLDKAMSYWALSLSQEPTKLFRCTGNIINEIKDSVELQRNMRGFPFSLNYEVVSDRKLQAYSAGDKDSKYLTEQNLQFMHLVDDLFSKKFAEENLPIIVLGTQHNRSDFEQITKHKENIIGQIEGDFATSSIKDIEKVLDSELKKYLEKELGNLLSELNETIGKMPYAIGVKDVWKNALEGKIMKLFIEENYEVPAYINKNNPNEIITYDKPDVSGGFKDLTEGIVSKVIHSKGKVYFFKPGDLTKFEKIAAVLRY